MHLRRRKEFFPPVCPEEVAKGGQSGKRQTGPGVNLPLKQNTAVTLRRPGQKHREGKHQGLAPIPQQKHHQQVYNDSSPCVTEKICKISQNNL